MNILIKRYEGHKEVLISHLQKAVKELGFIQDEEQSSNKETREFMAEVMDYITYLNACIGTIESKIKRLKRQLEEEA